MLSSYFEARNRRADRLENESNAERRHQDLMTALIAAISNGRNQGGDQTCLIETLLQRVEALEGENARLRQQNGNGNPPPQATPGE